MALGITWILDGLEVTIAGAVAGALQQSPNLRLSATEIGLSASAYLAGAVSARPFGIDDRLGRKLLFNVTLGLYLVAAALTAFSWSFWSYALFRFLTGAGIGGEYTAINSAIQELIPARMRGWTARHRRQLLDRRGIRCGGLPRLLDPEVNCVVADI